MLRWNPGKVVAGVLAAAAATVAIVAYLTPYVGVPSAVVIVLLLIIAAIVVGFWSRPRSGAAASAAASLPPARTPERPPGLGLLKWWEFRRALDRAREVTRAEWQAETIEALGARKRRHMGMAELVRRLENREREVYERFGFRLDQPQPEAEASQDTGSAPSLEIMFDPEMNPAEYVQFADVPEDAGMITAFKQIPSPTPRTRKLLKVGIRNRGLETAVDCDATLQLIRRVSECTALSSEAKPLECPPQIKPGPPSAPVVVAFSQSYDMHVVGGRCAESKDGRCILGAWISVKGGPPQNQDGMCPGQYDVRIRTRPSRGAGVQRDFRLTVTEDWRAFSMQPLGPTQKLAD